jgi:hypothetical protein
MAANSEASHPKLKGGNTAKIADKKSFDPHAQGIMLAFLSS